MWWVLPDQQPRWYGDLLDAGERERRSALRQAADRARFTAATAVVKLAAGRRLGIPAGRVRIDRQCADCGRPHGRPRLPGLGLSVSISHSGDRVAVALASGPPVGVDVERVVPVDVAALAGQVLAAPEQAADPAELLRYWTRKEAVVKATGDGLRTPLSGVVVAPPGQPARLDSYAGRPGLHAILHDLAPGYGYLAALAVLAPGPLVVRDRDATALQ